MPACDNAAAAASSLICAPNPAQVPAANASGPAAAAELAVLRADLAASDAETEHLLSHLALLQRHVSNAAADGSAHSTAAAGAGGKAAGLGPDGFAARGAAAAHATAEAEAAEVLASEVEFLREVGMV
jgi:hypothetical protein